MKRECHATGTDLSAPLEPTVTSYKDDETASANCKGKLVGSTEGWHAGTS